MSESGRAAAAPAAVCCRRPMTAIEVTQPLGGRTLALLTCASCGRHLWAREGQVLARAEVLDTVKDRVAEGPAPRPVTPRGPRVRAPRPVASARTEPAAPARPAPPARLAEFIVHGTPRT